MHKVITINLNAQVYQIDEKGYELLRAYLEQAELQLNGNPDRSEIIRDLEQSIAEKFVRNLNTGRIVVTTSDVEQVLLEIGPVDGGPAHAGYAHTVPGGGNAAPRRLYQIREGAMISGVCNGLAAYFNVDPTIVRIAFITAAIIEIAILDNPPVMSGGLYLILMFLVPYAKTSAQRVAAHGAYESFPSKVQHNVERLKGLFGGLRHGAH